MYFARAILLLVFLVIAVAGCKHKKSRSNLSSDANTASAGQLLGMQAAYNQFNSRLDEFAFYYGLFMTIRDQALLGKDGLFSHQKRLLAEREQWLTKTLAIVTFVNEMAGKASSDILLRIKADLSALSTQKNDLTSEYAAFNTRCAGAQKFLLDCPRLPSNFMDFDDTMGNQTSYRDQVEFYNSSVSNLVSMVSSSCDLVTGSKIDEINRLTDKTYEYIRMNLKSAALSYPELERGLSEILSMLQVSQTASPIYADLNSQFIGMQSDLSLNRIFGAKERQRTLANAAGSYKSKISQSASISQVDKDQVISQIDRIVNDSTGEISLKIGGSTLSKYVRIYLRKTMEEDVGPYCRDISSPIRFQYNCALLAQVEPFHLRPDTLKDLDETQLALLEKTITDIYAGPLGQ